MRLSPDSYAVVAHLPLAVSRSSVFYWSLISPYIARLALPVIILLLLIAALAFYGVNAALSRRAAGTGAERGSRRAALALMLLGPVGCAPVVTLLYLLVVPLVLFVEDVTGISAFAVATVGCLVALALVGLVFAHRTRQREPNRLKLLVASGIALVLLTAMVGLLLIALALFGARSSYTHLASATHAGYRYHLAREDITLENPTLHLYRCDALGVFCEEVDSLGYDATVHSGLLDVDERSSTVTVHATDGQTLFTYRLRDFFLP